MVNTWRTLTFGRTGTTENTIKDVTYQLVPAYDTVISVEIESVLNRIVTNPFLMKRMRHFFVNTYNLFTHRYGQRADLFLKPPMKNYKSRRRYKKEHQGRLHMLKFEFKFTINKRVAWISFIRYQDDFGYRIWASVPATDFKTIIDVANFSEFDDRVVDVINTVISHATST